MINTRTKGSAPSVPKATQFIEASTNSVTLHLNAWSDGGCSMLYFVVKYRSKMLVWTLNKSISNTFLTFYYFLTRLGSGNQEWTLVSNQVKPGGNFVVLDLSPATWYNLHVTAHNTAGSTVAEYEFATLTTAGGTPPFNI